MSTADQLVELMFSWIEQRELCAEQLKKLAKELESLRQKCNASECVGSSLSVVGAASLLGAGLATVFTGGAAAPLLGLAGGVYTGVGLTISLVTKITEGFLSSSTLKKAQEIEEKSNKIAEKIQKQFEKLKVEVRKTRSLTDKDEEEQHVMAEILKAVARRYGVKLKNAVSMVANELRTFSTEPRVMGVVGLMALNSVYLYRFWGILSFFTVDFGGKQSKLLLEEGIKQLVKEMSSTGLKTALKGGAKVAGGAVGLAFSLSEATDNWKDLIKKNHVTEASQSVRDTADKILKICRTLKEQFDNMRRMIVDLERERKQKEEKEKRKREREKEEMERRQREREMDEESDREDEESEEEESDRDDEESDSEEETEDNEWQQAGRKKRIKLNQKKSIQSKQRGKKKSKDVVTQDVRIGQDQKNDSNISEESNQECETNKRPPPSIRTGLLNVRSMNNKTTEITELIPQNNLDVFLTTETWLKLVDGGDVISEASPPNFSSYYQVRGSTGGGTAIQFSNELWGEQIHFDNITRFEYVAATLQHDEWDQPILIINVYRPPGTNSDAFRAFLREFQGLLDEAYKNFSSIIVTGDFNIWVDQENRTSTDEFDFLLLHNDLVQHVQEPTHRGGHTLDLVITRNVEISDLFVRDDGISDHFTVYFNMTPKTKEENEENEQAKQCKHNEE